MGLCFPWTLAPRPSTPGRRDAIPRTVGGISLLPVDTAADSGCGLGLRSCHLSFEGDVKGIDKDTAIQARPTFASVPLFVSGKEGKTL